MNHKSKWVYQDELCLRWARFFLTYVQIISVVKDTQFICCEGWAQVEERKHATAQQKHLPVSEDVRSAGGWGFAGVTGEAS